MSSLRQPFVSGVINSSRSVSRRLTIITVSNHHYVHHHHHHLLMGLMPLHVDRTVHCTTIVTIWLRLFCRLDQCIHIAVARSSVQLLVLDGLYRRFVPSNSACFINGASGTRCLHTCAPLRSGGQFRDELKTLLFTQAYA